MSRKVDWSDFGDVTDPTSLVSLATAYLQAMRVANYSKQTVQTRQKHLRPFFAWCSERGLVKPEEVTSAALGRYQSFLFHYRKASGEPLDVGTQKGMLVTVKMLFRWLAKKGHLPSNPASELELPKTGQRLPQHVFTPEEIEKVLLQPKLETTVGLRDRAAMEVLYSTGIRRFELVGLKVNDLDGPRGVVYVRRGKGDKDRVVPIGERAIAWVKSYLEKARPKLVVDDSQRALLLTQEGEPVSVGALTYLVRQAIEAAGIDKPGACHVFRHAMATAMLENGADIRFIQEILGHAKVTSTEIYTHVAIGKLKAIHAATHPGAKLEKPKVEAQTDPKDALLAQLEAEAEEDDPG
jgi:integrase/recombinase XerD